MKTDRGALFNTNVLQADKNLALGMRQMMSAGTLAGNSLAAARNINVLFSSIAAYKTLIQHQYLLHLMRY